MQMEGTLYDQIYRHLSQEIQTGKLKSGDRVPSEKELAAIFQVSRITSKKALEKLFQEGAIRRIRGKGSFVAETTSLAEPLSERKPALIGLILAGVSDCFGLTMLSAIVQQLTELGYHAVIKLTGNRQDAEEQAIRSLLQLGVQGLLINPIHGEHYNEELLKLVYRKFPIVLIDKHLKGIPACAVYTNHKGASTMLTEYLFQQGHEQIAFVSSPEERTSSIEERLHGFTAAFLNRGKAIHADAIFTSVPIDSGSRRSSEESLRSFLRAHPHITAVVACEYEIALFLSHVLQTEESVHTPLRIVCFDSPIAPYELHRYSHIRQNETEIARKSVELLLKQMQGQHVPLHNIVDYSFIE
jgi:GntR family transcriptional regulator of arabinose operon